MEKKVPTPFAPNDLEHLRKSQATLQAILDTTVDGIITIDSKGHIQSFNPAAETIFGYSASEVLGENISSLMPEPYRSHHDRYLSAYLATGEKKIIGRGREAVGLRKNGTTFPIYLAVSQTSVEGEVFFSGIVRDISAQKEYEAKLIEANRELEGFAHTLSHDLRNLLAPILGYADLLLNNPGLDLDETIRSCLSEIDHQAQKMEKLIDDLLDLAQAGHLDTPETPVDFDALARETAREIRRRFELPESGIEIRPSGLQLRLHPTLLELLLSNLARNAAHHGGPDGLPICISAGRKDKCITLSVADHGPGVPEGERDYVFDAFFRGSNGRRKNGTGIGLATVRKIALHYDGRAWVEETPGGGATFFVELKEPAH